MITFHKHVLAAGAPAIIGTVFLATALGAAETLSIEGEDATVPKASVSATAEAPRANGKGDLKMDLAEVHSRHMRCVSREATTTCTGWPIAAGMLAYKD